MPVPDDVRAFLAAHPRIESIDLLISDLNGVMRGKRIPRRSLDKVFERGMALPASVFALDILGNTIEATGLGFSTGDADRVCRPLPGSLVAVPWAPRSHQAQLLMTMEEADGSPFFADPRQVLARQLKRLAARGLTPVVAVELEFHLVDRERSASGELQPPRSPASGERASLSRLYSIQELDEYAELLEAIQAAAEVQGLPLDTLLTECAPGQFEITLTHGADALAACDHAVLLKRLIKGVAWRHGLEATFMAKPYGQEAGNGTHVHLSLVDAEERNVFAAADGAPLGTPLLHQAVAGLLELMPACMALFAPNLNSYRRLQPGLYVPLAPSWGFDNRSVAVRIPSGPNAARRLEHRVAGADANPYLLLAALLAGIEHGLAGERVPPAPITGNAYEQCPPTLTNSWCRALELLEASEPVGDALGRDFVAVFLANRRAERDQALRHVSRLELDWYLRHV
ncbi:glutamine synthetase family protein [Halomonas sp. BM-2019]|uniref:glutamine synthetase family protein n=1 Tax=Halomonas sp. BM-2019 TaxID=2811227 RepID=UPI001B3C280A|nr:MAG: glutamine synthetase [Halomonas sp. BM-2019]